MALPALALVPGRAVGRVHLVDDPLAWSSDRDGGGDVLSLPSLWWPPGEPLPAGARAVLLQGVPETIRADEVVVPTLAGVDADLLREGETVAVDGDAGAFRIDGVEEIEVVTVFLQRSDGAILLLQRSDRVGSFQGHWAGVSGFLEDPTPIDQALREVREETGLGTDALRVAAAGTPVLARDGAKVFVVHPFRFRADRTDVRLDWEHTRAEWVDPSEIRRRPTVPKLDRVWSAVAPQAVPKA
ncbi:MAG TPA: NUDIX domain-containing protein [Thermoplasmata archaeon]|nr:NUDIX domain-containing protein [Thermoplasmata archaeon]